MPPRHDLNQIQRWLQAVITDPAGIEPALDGAEARQHIDIPADQVETVIARSRKLSSVERLQIYANAYYARLVECLREEFPSLVQALGDETFGGFVVSYLQAYPSRSYTLNELGCDFPKFLEQTCPEERGGATTWADFLIDLARVERTYNEVFDGPGSEGQRTLQPEDIAALPPERWPEARLIPVPSLRLMTVRFPVHEYITAVRHQATATFPAAAPTYLVISRRDYVVRRASVSAEEYKLLEALVSGCSVGDAIERWMTGSSANEDELASTLQDWFRAWGAAGYFERVE